MEKDYQKSRIKELLARSESSGIFTYTDFLSPEEAAFAMSLKGSKTAFGGMEESERLIVRFGDENIVGYEEAFPIRIIKLSPQEARYSDKLGHRDFLGALMNLGIDRSVLGDILVRDNTAYVFVHERMSSFIKDNICFVKHTAVSAFEIEELPQEIRPERVEIRINVASNRLDAVISRVFGFSRTKGKELIREGRVLLNGVMVSSESKTLEEGYRISVRGYGKFMYRGLLKETKKKRELHIIEKYI